MNTRLPVITTIIVDPSRRKGPYKTGDNLTWDRGGGLIYSVEYVGTNGPGSSRIRRDGQLLTCSNNELYR